MCELTSNPTNRFKVVLHGIVESLGQIDKNLHDNLLNILVLRLTNREDTRHYEISCSDVCEHYVSQVECRVKGFQSDENDFDIVLFVCQVGDDGLDYLLLLLLVEVLRLQFVCEEAERLKRRKTDANALVLSGRHHYPNQVLPFTTRDFNGCH